MKKTIKVQVTYIYELEIDTESEIVKEYVDDEELLQHLASYRFSILPVIDNGVEFKDVELQEWFLV